MSATQSLILLLCWSCISQCPYSVSHDLRSVPAALQSPDPQFQREGDHTCEPKNHSSPPRPSSLQSWTECAQIDASAQLLIIMLWLFHPAVEKICLDFTARADGSLIVKQHCRKSPWTQTPHFKSFPANPPHPPVFLSRSSWKDVLFLKGKLWHSHLNRLQWK